MTTLTETRFRPLETDDGDRLVALFTRLSLTSRYRRFFSPKPALTRKELAFLTDVDHVSHEAIVAVDQRDGTIVGVARYVQVADRVGVAEVAAEVADELQNMGIGTALATRLLQRARSNGFRLLIAEVLWDNRPALALLRRLGFRARASRGSSIELALDLAKWVQSDGGYHCCMAEEHETRDAQSAPAETRLRRQR